MDPTLLVITGPTGIGKTGLSIETALRFGSVVLSADSRQMYREMEIGTARPTAEQMALVPHYFVGHLSIHDYYNASRFEEEALELLSGLFLRHRVVVMTGGSMMYIDAVRRGIDDLPTVDPVVREKLLQQYETEGIESLRFDLRRLDPGYYHQVDLHNHMRLLHALEICLMTGKPYSAQLTRTPKKREFRIVTWCLDMEREVLYARINKRVDEMVELGLEEEARRLYPLRSLNALNTVGYREWFAHFDGKTSRETAIEEIKSNTRRYARKQLTWFRRDPSVQWFDMQQAGEFVPLVEKDLAFTAEDIGRNLP